MKMGRPTKYDPSFVGIAEKYLDSCSREQTELPTIEGLALKLEVDDETIGIWANAKKKELNSEGKLVETDELLYPDFSAAVKKITRKQKNQLINDGLYGGKEINTAMAIFLLKVNHGMVETDKHIVETKGAMIDLDDEEDKVHRVGTVSA